MNLAIISLHFGFAAVWLGCVVTEALFERALLAGDRESHLTLADLHARVDLFIEVPAIAIVVATGVYLWLQGNPSGPGFYVMLTMGLIAIIANSYCVWLVFRRRHVAHLGDWSEFDRLDHQQHKVGAVVLIGLLAAIVSGVIGNT